MPSKSEKQRRFMGAELSRLRSGEKTETDMSEEQLSDYAAKEAFVLSLIDEYLDKDKKNVCPKCGKDHISSIDKQGIHQTAPGYSGPAQQTWGGSSSVPLGGQPGYTSPSSSGAASG